ncbi:MAG: hypothetical protein KKB51_24085, partial [Candidatus Riflebacteria bacterium]|nr:hypothetical protein [Candidatus Riflebacteria bacterium]
FIENLSGDEVMALQPLLNHIPEGFSISHRYFRAIKQIKRRKYGNPGYSHMERLSEIFARLPQNVR